MLKPVLKDDAFVADVEQAQGGRDHFHLWWLGQSGFLLQWNGRRMLFDPYLSDSLTQKYSGTDKPHVRMTERVVAPERLPLIDVCTSTHNHTDHLDAETLLPLLHASPHLKLVIPEANRAFVADRLGTVPELPIGLDQGEHITLKDFDIHAVPAAHEMIELDAQGRCKFLGYVVQFGGWTIYHCGDSVRYPEMSAILQKFKVDLALLPINGAKPERRVSGNLNGREAAELARDIGARCVIPCHFEMFEFNSASPDEFVVAARALGVGYRVLKAGERWSSREMPH